MRLVEVLKACDNWNNCDTCVRKEKCILAWDRFCDKVEGYRAQVENAVGIPENEGQGDMESLCPGGIVG